MEFEYHVCGKGFVGCPGDASDFARRLEQIWAALPVSGAKPSLYHWHKHYDPYAGTATVGGQYLIERTGNPSVNPVFILFAQTIGTPVRPPPGGWDELRAWLDGNGWGFVALLGEERYRDGDAPPDGTIPLSGTMFELFDAVRTGVETHLVVYDLSRLTQPPSPDTREHQRQRAWRQRLIAELGKTYTVRAPETPEEFDQRVLKDLKAAFDLPALDPLHGALPRLAAVGVDEPLLFGRDELIETLSRRIMVQGAAFTRVWGVSGAGKSSLLRAGLMGSWFDRSRGQAGLLAKATALLIEPFQLGALDPDPLRALGLLLTRAFADRDTGAIGPSPSGIAASLPDLPLASGNRIADLRAARTWWDELAAALDGPFVLILDQAEQIDAQAKREARDRVDRDSTANQTPLLSPVWRRFVDLITSLAGVADYSLGAPPLHHGPTRFRLVLGLHRESAIDLWACDKASLLANPSIEVSPLTDWRMVIQNTIAMYGLTLDEPLLSKMAAEADQLTNERQPVRTDDLIADDTRYDQASVLPLVKAALLRLITAWRLRTLQAKEPPLTHGDKTLEFATFAPVSGIADCVDALGEAAIDLWVRAVTKNREVPGLFEQEAFERELDRRFNHLLMGLIDVGEKGRAELNYIRRDGELARDETSLVSALRTADLLTGPDAEHWRLPHRVVINNWRRGRGFIAQHETRLATKRRLVLAHQSGDPAADWREQDIGPFVDLAFGWIGNDEGDDEELHDYLRSGLTALFKPERFSTESEDALDRLPLLVVASGQDGWAEQLFECAIGDRSWDMEGSVWTLAAAAFGRQDWLKRIFERTPSPLCRQFANHLDPASGAFPLLTAAQEGHAACVRLLLEHEAEPNQVDPGKGTFPLFMATQNGHGACVSLLLDKGADPNRINDSNGASPLLQAAHQGHADCVSRLLGKGAEPNYVNAGDGNFPLLMAAQNGHAECVRLLLENGAEPNRVNDKDGTFPLPFASQNGYADCVRLLLGGGAEGNQVAPGKGGFALLQAAQNGHANCVGLLLDWGAEPSRINDKSGSFPLLQAAHQGHADCVHLLLNRGADPNQVDRGTGGFPLLSAAHQGNAECVRMLLDKGAEPSRINDNNGTFALLVAALNGHADCVRLLLDKGADPNQIEQRQGTFPLLLAAQNGHVGCVRCLLDKGAEPNQNNERNGIFPLLIAAHQGHADCAGLLLDRGGEPNQINERNGTFPLLQAVQNGHTSCVALLLDGGAEPNRINDKNGTFPLLFAARNGHAACTRLLLDQGAEPNQVDPGKGGFPLLLAAENGHADCVSLLLDKGAKPNQRHLPTGDTALTVALRLHHWPVVRILGQLPEVLETAPSEVRRFVEEIIRDPDAEARSLEPEPLGTSRPRRPARPVAIQVPVSPGKPVQRNLPSSIWNALGLALDAIEPGSIQSEAWCLNGWHDALVRVQFRLADARIELQALVFDLPSFERSLHCVPGFDFGALAHSLKNAGRALDLRNDKDAFLWASLLLTYQYGGVPILPNSPWPPVPGAMLPGTAYREEDWRRWEFAATESGPTVTLPMLLRGHLLQVQFVVPEDGIGAELAGRPRIIMPGLDFPVPRFLSLKEGGPPTGLWLVREIELD